MNGRRAYDLAGVDAASLQHIREAIAFSGGALRVRAEQDAVARLVVEGDRGEDLEYIDRFITSVRAKQRKLRRRVLHQHRGADLYTGEIDETLERSGEVYRYGDGLVGLRGRALAVFEFFESEFRGLARAWSADERRYPAMLPVEILEEVGYFTNFPQHITMCCHFPEDLPFLDRLARSAGEGRGRVPAEFLASLSPAQHVLQPAVCLPCYRQFRNCVVEDDDVWSISMQNHVFRYEASNFRSLSRLWDFTVRDVVFFGPAAELQSRRAEVMRWAFDLCRELDLDARVELANDPFFVDPARDKTVYQRMSDAKYELLLTLPQRGDSLAVSSFNLHRDYYARVYDLRRRSGAFLETACMGFGIERWAYGFLSQKGLEPARWPARVRAFVEAAGGRCSADR